MSLKTAVTIHIAEFDVYGKADFDKSEVKKAMRLAGRKVQKTARQLVSRKVISKRDENPGRQSGVLRNSIRMRIGSSGFWVKIEPQKTARMADFYPAYLYYGVRRGARRQRSHHKGASGGNGWRIAPRKNFMEEALRLKQGRVKAIIGRYFGKALKINPLK